jgi:hypothetical protein
MRSQSSLPSSETDLQTRLFEIEASLVGASATLSL